MNTPPLTEPHSTLNPPRSLLDLFFTFTILALQGFGGVLAVAQRDLVERKRWLTRDAFLEFYSVAQILPGPNIVNLALMLGDRFFGWRGALVALAGMLAIPLLIVLTLASSYNALSDIPAVTGALRGMSAVAAGLMLAMGLRMLVSLRTSPLGVFASTALLILTLFAVTWLGVPLVWVLPAMGVVGWTLAYLRLRKRSPE